MIYIVHMSHKEQFDKRHLINMRYDALENTFEELQSNTNLL